MQARKHVLALSIAALVLASAAAPAAARGGKGGGADPAACVDIQIGADLSPDGAALDIRAQVSNLCAAKMDLDASAVLLLDGVAVDGALLDASDGAFLEALVALASGDVIGAKAYVPGPDAQPHDVKVVVDGTATVKEKGKLRSAPFHQEKDLSLSF